MNVMKNAKLSEFFKEMLEIELLNVNDLIDNKQDVNEYKKFISEFYKFEGKDREIVLEDLKCDEGILYKKMCSWNESELVIKLELNMLWHEYSIEDYFRDAFDKDDECSLFKLFSLDEINSVLYNK
jgi:hypothetical protein